MQYVPFLVGALFGTASIASAQVDADGAPTPQPVSQAPIFDDLTQVSPAWESLLLLDAQQTGFSSGHAQPESLLAEPRAFTGPIPAKVEREAETFSKYSVDRLLTTPLYDDGVDQLWTRVRGMKASFGADGFTAYPVFGKNAQGTFAVQFDLRSVMVGGTEVVFGSDPTAARAGDRVTLNRGSVSEVYNVALDQIEQTFVFGELPAGGDLVVNVGVNSNLEVATDRSGIHFVHPDFGGVTYGDAFVVDADGNRMPISRTWTGSSIELTVPAEFLAGATFPVTVDPPVTSFTSTAGVPDDSNADICFAGGPNVYWVTWQDYVSGTHFDTYAASFNTAGTVVDFISIDLTQNDWTEPKIAYHVGTNRCLIVANQVEDGTGFGSIQGRFIDCATGTASGAAFIISSFGALKVHADVGGNNWNSLTNSYFCVVWSSVWSPGSYHQIQYRIVNHDGTLVTGLQGVTASGEVHNEPAISETHGDGDLFGDWWTAAWVNDSDNNGFGSIMARRIVWSGATTLGAGNFTVNGGLNCSAPCVTSRFNRNLQHIADRPSIVAYEEDFPTLSGTPARQRSIYANVVTDGVAEVTSEVSWQLEDFDLELDQREPAIACDGNCFYLIYTEIYYGNPAGSDYDMYMLSGCIQENLNSAEMALAERHDNMAFSGSAERNGAVATIWDGEENSISDDGMAIWEDQNVTNGGTLEGYTLEIPTTNQSLTRAVGRQFCDNHPNSGGGQFGRQASWSWLLGNQSVGSTHFYYCTDMPDNTFGYAVIGMNFANINMPAGSLGRLCVPGGGRYVDQIGNSGTSGQILTTITPGNVPSPTGFISMQVGQTWGFQYWHRDVDMMGVARSNFSTACRMQFTN